MTVWASIECVSCPGSAPVLSRLWKGLRAYSLGGRQTDSSIFKQGGAELPPCHAEGASPGVIPRRASLRTWTSTRTTWEPMTNMDSWSQPQVSGIGHPGGCGPEDAHLGLYSGDASVHGVWEHGSEMMVHSLSCTCGQREDNDYVRQDPELLLPWTCPYLCQRLEESRGGRRQVLRRW